MNILVTGANGQLGNELRIVAADAADNYVFTDVEELDITDAAAVEKMVADEDISLIINCAAYTNVDGAEDNEALAELLNAAAVGNLARAMKRHDGVLVHVSTDYVFGGSAMNTPVGEEVVPCPTGVYGLTKLHGEQEIERSGCRALVIRTAWLYSEFGKNFVKTMLALTSSRPELKVVIDQVGTPTYALDLARAIFKIVNERLYEGREGLYHFSNLGVCSWYDFAQMIARMAGNTGCRIAPCTSGQFPSKVVRPSFSVLDKTKIINAFGLEIPYWVDSLAACIKNLNK